MPEHEAFKNRVTLLLGRNISKFKLKPFLIHKSENPHAFKNISKHTQMAIYNQHNLKAWITQVLFEDWCTNYFILLGLPREVCQTENYSTKVEVRTMAKNKELVIILSSWGGLWIRRRREMVHMGGCSFWGDHRTAVFCSFECQKTTGSAFLFTTNLIS